MDKLYSRRRIVLPKICFGKFSNGKRDIRKQRMLKISLTLVIALCAMVWIVSAINPVIDKLCLDSAKRKATLVSNEKATEVMASYEYEDLVTLYKDSEDNIAMVKSNIAVINKITSDIAVKIQEEFENNDETTVHLRLR